jgi:hypothetical protein
MKIPIKCHEFLKKASPSQRALWQLLQWPVRPSVIVLKILVLTDNPLLYFTLVPGEGFFVITAAYDSVLVIFPAGKHSFIRLS